MMIKTTYICAGCHKPFANMRGFQQHQAHLARTREAGKRPECPKPGA